RRRQSQVSVVGARYLRSQSPGESGVQLNSQSWKATDGAVRNFSAGVRARSSPNKHGIVFTDLLRFYVPVLLLIGELTDH
ncbi:hypothetical protein GWI33_008669, partial [Rhynchophorus ferrugineus]